METHYLSWKERKKQKLRNKRFFWTKKRERNRKGKNRMLLKDFVENTKKKKLFLVSMLQNSVSSSLRQFQNKLECLRPQTFLCHCDLWIRQVPHSMGHFKTLLKNVKNICTNFWRTNTLAYFETTLVWIKRSCMITNCSSWCFTLLSSSLTIRSNKLDYLCLASLSSLA